MIRLRAESDDFGRGAGKNALHGDRQESQQTSGEPAIQRIRRFRGN